MRTAQHQKGRAQYLTIGGALGATAVAESLIVPLMPKRKDKDLLHDTVFDTDMVVMNVESTAAGFIDVLSLRSFERTSPTIRRLEQRVKTLEERLEQLEENRAELLKHLEPRVVVLRELARDEAKQEVLEYFRTHPGSYPSDAAIELRLAAALVRDLSLELMREGLLAG